MQYRNFALNIFKSKNICSIENECCPYQSPFPNHRLLPKTDMTWRIDLLSFKFIFHVYPGSLDGKEFTCNAGDLGSIPRLGRSPGEGNNYLLQYSGLKNSMDRGAWWAIVHGVTKSWTWLSDIHFHLISINICLYLSWIKIQTKR